MTFYTLYPNPLSLSLSPALSLSLSVHIKNFFRPRISSVFTFLFSLHYYLSIYRYLLFHSFLLFLICTLFLNMFFSLFPFRSYFFPPLCFSLSFYPLRVHLNIRLVLIKVQGQYIILHKYRCFSVMISNFFLQILFNHGALTFNHLRQRGGYCGGSGGGGSGSGSCRRWLSCH